MIGNVNIRMMVISGRDYSRISVFVGGHNYVTLSEIELHLRNSAQATDAHGEMCEDASLCCISTGAVMNLPVKIRRDWHYYAFAIGLIFILNGVVGLLGFEAQGWQTYAVGLVTG